MALERVTLALGLAPFLLPFAAGLPLTLGLGLAAIFKANEAFRRGEDDAAMQSLVEGLAQFVDAVGPPGSARGAPRLSKLQSPSARLLGKLGVDARQTVGLEPNSRGIFRTASGHFLVRTTDGPLVRIKSDFKADSSTLNVVHPHSGRETDVHLAQGAGGGWLPTQQLPGGGLVGERLLVEGNLLPDEHSARAFLDTFDFPAGDQRRSRLQLASDMINGQGEIPLWALRYRTFPLSRPTQLAPVSAPNVEAMPASPTRATQVPAPIVSDPTRHVGPTPLTATSFPGFMPVQGIAHLSTRGTDSVIAINGKYYEALPGFNVKPDGSVEAFIWGSGERGEGSKDGQGFLNPESNRNMPYRATYHRESSEWTVDLQPVHPQSAVMVMARLVPDMAGVGYFVQKVLENKLLHNKPYHWGTTTSVANITAVLQKMEREALDGSFDPMQFLTPEPVTAGASLSGGAFGAEFKITAADQQSIASAVAGGMQDLGAVCERVARDTVLRMGYEILPGAQYRRGINGVDITFKKTGGSKVYIMEVKQAGTGGIISLARASKTNPQQMSKEWVAKVLGDSRRAGDPSDTATQAIHDASINGSLVKLVAGFSPETFKVVRLPHNYR